MYGRIELNMAAASDCSGLSIEETLQDIEM